MENTNLTSLFAELFPEESDQEEALEHSFVSESDIDDNIEAVHELDAEINRFKLLYKEKTDKIKAEFDNKITKLNNSKEWILFNLKNSVLAADDKKETDTQFKKSYLSGSIVVKKSKTNMLKPELTEEIILRDFADYKKEDTKITLNWKLLKSHLELLDGKVYNTQTGELLEDTILTEVTPESVVVK